VITLAASVGRCETTTPSGRCARRPPAAVALVLLEGPQGLELVLIKRAERGDDPWSGQIALPGGRYEVGDRDLERRRFGRQAKRRE